MSDKTKKQFYISDKPIDLADITPLETEYPEETFSPEPKNITMSFDCKIPKETEEWIKEQMKELHEKESEIRKTYGKIAKYNAEYYMPILRDIVNDETRTEFLESIILHALCKGWNDCFDINVKHEKQQTTL